ncbi:hypothetical protein WN51_03796 [Melipona quadrifasciata]|uniref:Uncharacterized protein n=1 Tax=Melipona quadrifasciata TaxID=166423 RepID=A0A0M8ZXB5_9HYME|nr:hypothetical protein WN51_03796 [Melipona quadrifasciata]
MEGNLGKQRRQSTELQIADWNKMERPRFRIFKNSLCKFTNLMDDGTLTKVQFITEKLNVCRIYLYLVISSVTWNLKRICENIRTLAAENLVTVRNNKQTVDFYAFVKNLMTQNCAQNAHDEIFRVQCSS